MAKQKTISFVPDKIKKPSGLKNDGSPNVPWRKFKERIDNFESVPVDEWGDEEVLGYIAKRYKDHYEIDFGLSYSGPPSKCGEMFLIRRMKYKIGTEKGHILKDYINWVFDKILIPQKMSLTSLAFFFTEKIVQQYRAEFKKRHVITKSTELPNDFIDIASQLELPLNTYGDLYFVKAAIDQDPDREDFTIYKQFLSQIKDKGFNEEILKSLEQ